MGNCPKTCLQFDNHNSQAPARKGTRESGNKNKKKKQEPLLRPVDHATERASSSRPALANKTLPTGVLGYVIKWADMRDTLLSSLEKKEVPTSADREDMVQIISEELKQLYDETKVLNPTIKQKTPGRNVYRGVVNALFLDFQDCYEDRIPLKNGKYQVIGDGKYSLMDQIETCVENKYRDISRKAPKCYVSKGNRKAACIIPELYNPVLSKTQKKDVERIRLELKAMYQENSSNWNWTIIKEKLLHPDVIAAQRNMICANKRDMNDIMQNWPFLFELTGLLGHLDKITGGQMMGNFESFVSDELDELIQFMTISSPKRLDNLRVKKNIDLKGNQTLTAKVLGCVLMLANHFDEKRNKLIFKVERGTLPHEVPERVENLPQAPSLVAFGDSIYTASEFCICMDGVCICTGLTGLEGLVALSASYLVFGNLYEADSSCTMTFIERIMAGLQDSEGQMRATTAKGGVSVSAMKKVQSLSKQIKKFADHLMAASDDD